MTPSRPGVIFTGVRRWLFASGAALLFFGGPLGAAEIFTFVDSAGVVHFSNVPTDGRYRPFSQSAPVGRPSKSSLLALLSRIAREQEVDAALVRAVVKAESDFNPEAVSYLGAQGLMQLMPMTSANLHVQNPFDPEENMAAGVRYLKYLLGLFHQDIPLALAAYHSGEKLVLRVGGIPSIGATQLYVQRVLKFYRRYRPNTPDAAGRPEGAQDLNRPEHDPGNAESASARRD